MSGVVVSSGVVRRRAQCEHRLSVVHQSVRLPVTVTSIYWKAESHRNFIFSGYITSDGVTGGSKGQRLMSVGNKT